MISIDNPALKVFMQWSNEVEKIVGKGNTSMSKSATLIDGKNKYARLFMLGNPTKNGDLEGNEASSTLSFQVDSFAKGTRALSDVYAIDDVSHKTMIALGFRRTYGPEMIENANSTFKRTVSRYTMLYTGDLLRKSEFLSTLY